MNQWPHQNNKRNSHDKLIGPDGRTYIFDRGRGIYKPQSHTPTGEDDNQDGSTQTSRWYRIEVRRDWWTFGITTFISVATFFIVCVYTFYAQKQAAVSEAANYNFMKANRDNGRTTTLTFGKMQGQIEQMGRLADRMGDQASQTKTIATQAVVQASAAQTLAGVTGDSVQTARNTLYWEQRPWVGVEVARIPTPPNAIQSPTPIPSESVAIIAINTGRTPALRWRQECRETMDRDSLYKDQDPVPTCDEVHTANRKKSIEDSTAFSMKHIPRETLEEARRSAEEVAQRSEEMLHHGDARNVGQTIVPNGARVLNFFTQIGNDTKIHYAVGTFTYFDALDPSKTHITNYCIRRVGDGPWALCEFGQDMN